MSRAGDRPGEGEPRPGETESGFGVAGASEEGNRSLGDFRMSETKRHGSLVIVHLAGRLDGRAAQQVQRRCDEMRHQGIRHLALELGQVTFLASSGLGVFLAETEEFKEAGGSLHLVSISSVVSSVVNLLNVGRFLSIAPSMEELRSTLETA